MSGTMKRHVIRSKKIVFININNKVTQCHKVFQRHRFTNQYAARVDPYYFYSPRGTNNSWNI